MYTLMKYAMQTQTSSSNSGGSWGRMPEPGLKQIRRSKDEALRLTDGNGSPLSRSTQTSLGLQNVFNERGRTSVFGNVPLENAEGKSPDSGRQSKPGQMVTSAALAIRSKKKQNTAQPKITKSTGGLRKMNPGQMRLESSTGSGL